MSIRYILGRSGAGKTFFCYQSMVEEMKKDDAHPLILLVPEQFTLQAQKDLVSISSNAGIMRGEVLSFQRLAHRIFGETGGIQKKILGETGKIMVIRKVIQQMEQELTMFHKAVKKTGFIHTLCETISEFYQYDIQPEMLLEQQEALDKKPILKNKMNDLYHIYKGFQEYIEKEYITTEGTLDILSRKLQESQYLKNAEIWIDGFYGFTPQQYRVIYQLARKVKRINITLTLDPKENLYESLHETDPFYESKVTFQKLNRMAAFYDIKIEKQVQFDQKIPYRFINSPGLAHLEKEYFRYPYETYTEVPKDIHIFSATNRYSEVENTAKQIIELVRDQNYRYRDVAVVTGGLEEYQKILEGHFAEYEIPFFIDSKKDVMAHPLIELIRSVLDIMNHQWSYESIFRYLKTNLVEIPRIDIDRLENYVLAMGIKGKSRWTNKDWELRKGNHSQEIEEKRYEEQELNHMNDIRKKVVEPLVAFQTKLRPSTQLTVEGITIALYELLEDLQASSQIQQWIERFQQEKKLLLVNENLQIWKLLMELFEKMVEILGKEKVSLEQYGRILDAGLEQCQMGLVPPGLDQVVIGDLERSRLHDIKALFILGANDGILPAIFEESSIFSDIDRVFLNGVGIEVAPDSRRKTFEEQFLIYSGITKPSHGLYISYSLGDQEGKALRPSILINRVKKIFPKLYETSDLDSVDERYHIQRPISTFHYLGIALRNWIDTKEISPLWWDVYSWYLMQSPWRDKTHILIDGLFHDNQALNLRPDSVKKLYGDKIYSSVSRLEKFVACPFAYFVQYGLQAQERRLYQLETPDLGKLFHAALDEFSRKLEIRNWKWREITEEQSDKLIDETIDEIAPTLGNAILYSTSRHKYLISRLKRITRRAIWALKEHIQRGLFEPLGFEVGFGEYEKLPPIVIELKSGEKIILTGRIDRVDILDENEKAYIKIIDYKSGNQQFDLVDIFYGIQLQLILYLDAFLNSEEAILPKELLPGGVFYFHIDDPMIPSIKEIEPSEIAGLLLKQLKMSGLVLADVDLVKKMDNQIDRYSDILPVQITKDGAFAKNASVASLDEFNHLREYVREIVTDIGSEIVKGNVQISPYKNKKYTVCQYCPYTAICQFDTQISNNEYRVFQPLKSDEVWEKLKDKKDK